MSTLTLELTMSAATESKAKARAKVFNVPNQVTALRFALSIAVFVLIPMKWYLPALIVFLIAASTDWIDGYWARKYNQVTQLGRIFDPFVDKIIICGTFIYLASEAPHSGIWPWMAVIVVGREILVTALRSFIEQSGGDFSANMSGKLKMVLQCAAVAASLIALMYVAQAPGRQLSDSPGLFWTVNVLVWLAVFSTIQSGLVYVFAAGKSILQ
jgi:CDP-diacylglycerol--glycerol-3-phosphate 3-phosphatidyltransferase